MSVCVQHELDHLDGIVFIDHLSQLKNPAPSPSWPNAARKKPAKKRPSEKIADLV